MANIRASVVVTSILSAALAAGSVSATVAPRSINAVYTPNISISAAIQLIPLKEFERQSVSTSDTIGPFAINKVIIDIATVSENVAIRFDKVLTDSVTATDLVNKVFVSNVDFDLSDPDVDPDPITISDSDIKSVGKNLTDATVISESNVKVVGTSKTETVQIQDQLFTNVGKNLDNSVSATEQLSANVGIVKTDSVATSETHEIEFTKGNISDAVTSSDLASLNAGLNKESSITAQDAVDSFDIGKNPSDSADATDAITTVSVDKVLSDSVVVTDFIARTVGSNVDFDRTDADIDPDPVTTSDVAVMSSGLYKADSVAMADTVAKAVQAVYSDTATVSDAIILELTLGDSVPLYDFAFIADDKYTYFPVPGTLNNHMIHQPLVNGEFVLTTDPNAGIVYTIRPEAVSYTFGWYGVNENQFN